MRNPDASAASAKTYFAITSPGKARWYWVVWPSLDALQSGVSVPHLADGYAGTKAVAVERALEAAGMHGEWVAAKYAKQYHRTISQARRTRAKGRAAPGAPASQEFLYRDIHDDTTGQYYSVPHRISRKTRKHVYVDEQPYDPSRLTGSWVDHGAATFRLSRTMLERDGYAFVPVTVDIDDPLFFATPYDQRVVSHRDASPACLGTLGLTFPCAVEEVRAAYRELVKQAHPDQGGSHEAFIALQSAYEEAQRLCRYPPQP